jgi:phosphatidate cytidylyltransferase
MSATPATSPSSELQKRVVSAAAMAAVAVAATIWGGWLFAMIWTAVAAIVVHEWGRIVQGGDWTGSRSLAAVLVVVLAGLAAEQASLLLIAMSGALAFVIAMVFGGARKADTLTGLIYASALGCAVILCRSKGYDGAVIIFWLFAVVWGTDIFAYFAGRSIGGPKLWPRVSPKKTWSGAIGGLVGGVILGAAILAVLGVSLKWQHLALSVMFSVLTQGGDLYESSIKRRFGVKDSGSIIPGHGGFMDRLDGFIFAVVFAAGFGALRAGADKVPAGLITW